MVRSKSVKENYPSSSGRGVVLSTQLPTELTKKQIMQRTQKDMRQLAASSTARCNPDGEKPSAQMLQSTLLLLLRSGRGPLLHCLC